MEATFERAQLTRALPGSETRFYVSGALGAAQARTDVFVRRIEALTPPDTEGGRRTKRTLDELVGRLGTPLDDLERQVEELPKQLSLIQSIHALNDLEQALVSTIGGLPPLDLLVSEDTGLRNAFDEADECRRLRELYSGK